MNEWMNEWRWSVCLYVCMSVCLSICRYRRQRSSERHEARGKHVPVDCVSDRDHAQLHRSRVARRHQESRHSVDAVCRRKWMSWAVVLSARCFSCCWLVVRKGIQPVKTLQHLTTVEGLADNVTSRWREDWQSATVVNSTLVATPQSDFPVLIFTDVSGHCWIVFGQARATVVRATRSGVSPTTNYVTVEKSR